MRDLSELIVALKAKIECIWVKTYEEADFIEDFREIFLEQEYDNSIKVWSNTSGLSLVSNLEHSRDHTVFIEDDPKAKEFPVLFDKYIVPAHTSPIERKNTAWILKGFDAFISNPKAIRYIRDLKEFPSANRCYNPIIVLSPIADIPDELMRLFKVINYETPTHDNIVQYLSETNQKVEKAKARNSKYEPLTPEEIEDYATLCQGLTAIELKNIIKESIVKNFRVSRDALKAHKIDFIDKTGMLSYKEPKTVLDDIGGHDVLKDWLKKQINIINHKEIAAEFGRKPPKGFMAVGIPGSGKTAIAEAFAGEIGVPLLVFDMSKVMNRMVGESEKAIAKALRIASSCSPCVLLMDEVEKALGGYLSSAASDSGVTDRIVGTLCSWMQDNEDVFIIMTSNNAAKLPPEFTRSGRLDTTWFFDFPIEEERRKILNVKLKNANRDITDKQKDMIISMTDHYTGAEIEQGLQNALGYSFEEYLENGNKMLTDEHLSNGFTDVVPIYRSSKGAMDALVRYYTGGEGKAKATSKIEDVNNIESDEQEDKWTLDF